MAYDKSLEQVSANIPRTDTEALTYISQAPPLNVPSSIKSSGDLLGLTEYDDVHAAITQTVFNRLDYVCAQVIHANPDIRNQYVQGKSIEVSRFTLCQFH